VEWIAGFALTVAVVLFVGHPLFVREAAPAEDALEAAIAQRRSQRRRGGAVMKDDGAAPRGRLVCTKCGEGNLAEDRYCARCGAALGLRCASCGAKYESGDLFCAGCGARLAGRQS
jgi:hypothetical protein